MTFLASYAANSSSTLRSRRLEVMGAGKNKEDERDTHVSLARPIISCIHYFQACYSSSSCGEKCCMTTQRTVFQKYEICPTTTTVTHNLKTACWYCVQLQDYTSYFIKFSII